MKRALWVAGAISISSALLVLSMPPGSFGLLGWIALAPLFLATRGARGSVGFGSGVGVGCLSAFLSASGLLYGGPSYNVASPSWIYVAFILFGVILGIVLAFWAEGLPVLQTACLAVLAEALSLVYLPIHIALSQSSSSMMLLMASVGGIWIVSFALWVVNMWLARILSRRDWLKGSLLFAACAVGGASWMSPQKGSLRIALVQMNEADSRGFEDSIDRAAAQGAEIVVMPELSGLELAPGGVPSGLKELSRRKIPAFVTSYSDTASPLPHNHGVYLRRGAFLGHYDKRKLFAGERTMHQAGTRPSAAIDRGYTVGLCICFDTCFPSIMRETANLTDVDLIVAPTLDPDTPHGVIQALHAAYSPFRAAELGMPIIRSDTTAYSTAVDSWGRVLAELPPGPGLKVTSVEPTRSFRFYRWAGDWVLYAAGIVLIVSILRRKKRPLVTDQSRPKQYRSNQ